MKFPDALEQLPTDGVVRRVYGEPYQTADGATVIPVARIRGGGVRHRPDDAANGSGSGFTAAPVGVFVVHGDHASWVPAVDVNRIALLGVVTGLLSAVIASLAVLRRPPWPEIVLRRSIGFGD
ncbi:MAG: GerW family sporulation protein [Mycobacterium sp.]|uniref:GerW family sporulation protein n=1 Tax=Mycobacterium sp. TaxID=1785 RepID=UPI002601F963|nr:GerW family sporulation protein [Mycobacterium sp.]MDI3313410.1 GerW family sporulation protein [Mycobacterium sp.]